MSFPLVRGEIGGHATGLEDVVLPRLKAESFQLIRVVSGSGCGLPAFVGGPWVGAGVVLSAFGCGLPAFVGGPLGNIAVFRSENWLLSACFC